MKRVKVYFAVVLTAMLAAVSALRAQQGPAVVVSIASVNENMADITYATEAAGVPQVAGLVQFMSAQYTQALDKTKPAGVLVSMDGPLPSAVVFLPVSNPQALENLITQNLGPLQDAGNGLKQIPAPQPAFMKSENGFVFVSNAAENLAAVPADPVAQLQGLDQKYNVAAAIRLSSVPDNLRQMMISQMRQGFEMQLQNIDDEDERRLREQLGRNSLDQITKFFDEGDQVVLGFAIDAAAKSTYLDVNVTVKPNTELARQVARMSEVKTGFAGLNLPNAAGLFTVTSVMEEAEKQQVRAAIEAMKAKALAELENDPDLPSEEARAAAKEVLLSLIDVLNKTVDEGLIDGGAVLTLESGTVQFVAGAHVADGNALQDAFKKILDLAKDEPDVPEVKFNADSHEGVTFHTMQIPIPDENAQKAFGDTLDVALGTGPTSAYIALGKGSVDLVKQIIDGSKQEKVTVPMQLVFSLSPILKFSSQFQDEESLKAAMAALEQAQGKDHIMIVGRVIPNGFNYRIEAEEGVLRVIGAAVSAQMQGGPGGF